MKRKDRVLRALRELAQLQIEQTGRNLGQERAERILGFSTSEIAFTAGVTRSNCSGELNELYRAGYVAKISGRPTKYWPADVDGLAAEDTTLTTHVNESANTPGLHTNNDVFSHVVGSSRSLLGAVRLAKMAVTYPPTGMHALILGEAGVGKSTFAKSMHSYAIETGLYEPSAPFVSFNCAEYANNPEILLDHLFGHVRGAYTGAVDDKPGLIEVANRGVLFLDEIHRLPPQGQEMLFHWLDHGTFRRMGEVDTKRHSQALLVAATTEIDESVLLLTFRRRIPVTINLPPLQEWSIYDRYELIYRCLFEEAATLNRPIRLTGDAVGKLLFAQIPGNIGGLRNVLKLACARAYAFENQIGELVIERHHVQVLGVDRTPFGSNDSMETVKDISVTPSQTPNPTGSNPPIFQESLYAHLSRLGERLQDIGLEHDEIVVAIERELMRRQFAKSVNPSLTELRKFVGESLYGSLRSAWSAVAYRVDPLTVESSFIRVCMHLAGLMRDAKDFRAPIDQSIFHHVRSEYPELCSIAESLLVAFARESGIQLPDHEVPLVALLLKPSVEERTPTVGVVLMMRGEGIATGIAQSVRGVSQTTNLVSIDVPLTADVNWIFDSAHRAVQMADSGKGVLILTDLPMIRDWSMETSNVHCLFRPDLTTVLQAILAIESGFSDIEDVLARLEPVGQVKVPRLRPGTKRRIWTCCMTGRGSAMALKRFIENALPADLLCHVEVIPVEVSQSGATSAEVVSDLIAMVGSVRPDVPGIPFLSVEELLAPNGMDRLINITHHMQSIESEGPKAIEEEHPDGALFAHAEEMLARDLVLINPRAAIQAAKSALTILSKETEREFDEAWQVRFAIHMAYVMERAIRGTEMQHPESATLQTESPVLWGHVKHALEPYEEWFQVSLESGEIAYVCDMLALQ